MIDSSALLDGMCGLRGLWLLSTMITSSFSSYVLFMLLPRWTLLGALPLVRDLLRVFYLFSKNDDMGGGSPVETMLCLPLWFILVITADSTGATQKAVRSLSCCSFVSRTKWYDYKPKHVWSLTYQRTKLNQTLGWIENFISIDKKEVGFIIISFVIIL